jgi:hypothetical protein
MTGYVINHGRFDMSTEAEGADAYFDIEYIAFFDSIEDAENYK